MFTTPIRAWFTVLNLLCVISGSAFAQPFDVDDPSTTELRKFYLSIGYVSFQEAGFESQAFPNFQLSYGLKDNLELFCGFGVLSAREAEVKRETGQDDTLAGVRWRFMEESERRPQLLLGYQSKIPTASRTKGLGNGEFDHSLWISLGKSFQRYFLFANAGYNLHGESEARNNWFWGCALTYQLTESLNIGAQVLGNSPGYPGERHELAWGFGFTFNFDPDRSLMFKAGRSERGFSDLVVYLGVGFNIR